MADDYNKPNVSLDLAPSYDTRNVAAFAAMDTSALDQRKINCFYDVVRNSLTGRATVELTKRPGSQSNLGLIGSGNSYLISAPSPSDPWVAKKNGAQTLVTNNSTSTNILNDADYWPAWMDTTEISGTTTTVLQLRKSSISVAQRVWYASAIGSWTEISDATFTGLVHRGKMEHLDGFAFILTSNNRIYNSSVNSLSDWADDNYITKQIQSDTAAGLAKFKNQILAFGNQSVEVLVNAGNEAQSPLKTVPQMASKIGLADPNSASVSNITTYYTILGDRLYFVGRPTGGVFNAYSSRAVYAYNGQSFEKVSSTAIDKIISSTDVYAVYGMSFLGQSAVAIQFTAPGAATVKWIMFFPELKEWFEWQSVSWTPANSSGVFMGGGTVGNGYTHEMVGTNEWRDVVSGSPNAVTMTVQFKMPKIGNNRDFMNWCALDADTTSSSINIAVSFSDNDYSSFDTARNIDLSTSEKSLIRCGSYKTRAVRLTNADNANVRIRKFLARVG